MTFWWAYDLSHHRKVDSERTALTKLALHGNRASALFHNSVRGREAQASALARRFGGEEGLEQMSFRFLIHAVTRVLYFHHGIRGCSAIRGRFRGFLRYY